MAKRPANKLKFQPEPPDAAGINLGQFDDAAHPGEDGAEGDGGDGEGEGTGEREAGETMGASTHPPLQPQSPAQPPPPSLPSWPANGGPKSFHGWIHAATDAKGHENKIPLRIQPAIGRQMGLVIGSKRFPYRSSQELIRHAIYEHLRWLESIDGSVPSVMGVVDSINALINDENMLQEQADVLARHLSTVERHLQMGAYESAHRTVTVALTLLDKLPPGEWRDTYRAKFHQLYAYKPDQQVQGQMQAQLMGANPTSTSTRRGRGVNRGSNRPDIPLGDSVPDEGGTDD